MVTIADLKKLEDIRQNMLTDLKWKPLPDHEWSYGNVGHAYDLMRMGLVEMAWAGNDQWFWLTEEGFNRLGYKMPEHYGNPTCECCDGKGTVAGWEAGDPDEDCECCDGAGVDVYEVDDLFLLDEE